MMRIFQGAMRKARNPDSHNNASLKSNVKINIRSVVKSVSEKQEKRRMVNS